MKKIIVILILFFSVTTFGQDTSKVYKTFKSDNFEINDRIVTSQIAFSMGGGIYALEEYHDSIKVIADFLKAHPNISLEIGVHTDYRGSASANLKLSEYRAIAVKSVLENKFNIESTRLKIKGYGESDPIISEQEILDAPAEQKEDLHAINRRVEIKILKL